MSTLAALIRLPAADERVRFWHVSPLVDTLAYHFAWLFVLAPLAFTGNDRKTDYFWIFMIVMVVSFTHRHATFPYVYFDKQVFTRHPYRFVVLPGLMIAGLVASFFLYNWRIPASTFSWVSAGAILAFVAIFVQMWATVQRVGLVRLVEHGVAWLPVVAAGVVHYAAPAGLGFSASLEWLWLAAFGSTACIYAFLGARGRPMGLASVAIPAGLAVMAGGLVLFQDGAGVWPTAQFRFRDIVLGVFFIGAAWNVWHTFMQKYGILRMYAAKSEVPEERRVPGWVDRLLVFCWLPLTVVVLATLSGDLVAANTKNIKTWIDPIVATAQASAIVLYPVAVAVVVFAVGAWLYYERRATGLKNVPRVSMALGTFLGFGAFLVFDPVKVYIALGFGHAVEYLVFVWAFQRKRYSAPLAHKPLLGRLLKQPWLAYAAFFLVISGGYWFMEYSDELFFDYKLEFLDTTLGRWAFWLTVWGQIAHFYFDGFLWKMRLPTVRANL